MHPFYIGVWNFPPIPQLILDLQNGSLTFGSSQVGKMIFKNSDRDAIFASKNAIFAVGEMVLNYP